MKKFKPRVHNTQPGIVPPYKRQLVEDDPGITQESLDRAVRDKSNLGIALIDKFEMQDAVAKRNRSGAVGRRASYEPIKVIVMATYQRLRLQLGKNPPEKVFLAELLKQRPAMTGNEHVDKWWEGLAQGGRSVNKWWKALNQGRPI